jgi:hypothetical protein
LAALAQRRNNRAQMQEALASLRGAIEVYRQAGVTYWRPMAEARLRELEAELPKLKP